MRVALVIVVLSLGACLQSGLHHCEDGSLCGTDRVCSPRGGCVLPDQLAACDGLSDEATCALAGVTMGACYDGVCLPIGCGNGIFEPGEACDDGNLITGDGCSSRCDSTETCGNAFLDVSLGEQCDCGDATVPDAERPPGCTAPNSDAAGSLCRADCTFVGCGDGVASGLEDCDGIDVPSTCIELGFYGGTLACLPSCRFDVSQCIGNCGDDVRNGVVGRPVEACDGADLASLDCTDLGFYTASGLACTPACFFDTSACHDRCGDGLVNGPETCDGAPGSALACVSAGHDAGQLSCAAACYDTFENCHDVAVLTEFAGVASPNLRGVWGSGREFFACGNKGVSHTTGGAWAVMQGSPAFNGCDVWGSATDDVWLVGNTVTTGWPLYHYDGAIWSQATGPAGTPAGLVALWGTSATSIWAVGSGKLFHYDGTWQEVTGPFTGLQLRDVWASGPNDIFVVGGNGLIYHWNGTVWQDQTQGSSSNFEGVWGRSPTEVYAVVQSFVFRYNGTAWTAQNVPGALYDVGGIPGGPVVVVGLTTSGASFMAQLVGTRWLQLAFDPIGTVFAAYGSENRLYAVGSNGALEWDGASWISPNVGFPLLRHGVWSSGYNTTYWTGGDDNTGDGKFTYWDGNSSTSIVVGTGFLFDVWGNDTSTIVAVGANGRAFHGSGTTFATKNTLTNELLWAVSGTGVVFYAVGDNGAISRFGGVNWSKETSGTTVSLRDVWTISATEAFAVGDNGTILHRTGSSWASMTSPTTAHLRSIWGRSASDLFVVGFGGTILHYDGLAWSAMPSASTFDLTQVWGSSTGVFVSGANLGSTLLYAGGRWLPFALKTSATTVSGISGPADLTVFFGSSFDMLTGSLIHPAASEKSCTDLWDDDNDGSTDCADADCANDAACAAPGGCKPFVDLACGQTFSGTTSGGALRFPYYGAGCSAKDEGGAEVFVRVKRPTAGSIQLGLSGYTGDLDLIVSGRSAQGACIADETCLAASQTSAATESASFAAAADTDYVVIVDGSASSSFMLSVTCP